VQKFSSNVVEKCLKLAAPRTRIAIIRELLGAPAAPANDNGDGSGGGGDMCADGAAVMSAHSPQSAQSHPHSHAHSHSPMLLLQDKYANYVLQTCLDVVDNAADFSLIVNALQPHLAKLRQTAFGKRVQAKIVKNRRFPGVAAAAAAAAAAATQNGPFVGAAHAHAHANAHAPVQTRVKRTMW
jgi:hypothetical protein